MTHLTGALSQLIGAQRAASAATARTRPATSPRPNATGQGEFLEALRERMQSETSGLRLSRHAAERLSDRRIELSGADLERLERATEKAAAKGAREALMMMGNLNLIVSLQNRTVVTAMEAGTADDTVYTNIDTAVIVGDGSDEQRTVET